MSHSKTNALIKFGDIDGVLSMSQRFFDMGLGTDDKAGINTPARWAVALEVAHTYDLTLVDVLSGVCFIEKNKPSLYGSTAIKVIKQSPGFLYMIEEYTGEINFDDPAKSTLACTIRCKKQDHPEWSFTYSVADAQLLGKWPTHSNPTSKRMWKVGSGRSGGSYPYQDAWCTSPKDMMYYRCTSRAAIRYFDVGMGVHSPEDAEGVEATFDGHRDENNKPELVEATVLDQVNITETVANLNQSQQDEESNVEATADKDESHKSPPESGAKGGTEDPERVGQEGQGKSDTKQVAFDSEAVMDSLSEADKVKVTKAIKAGLASTLWSKEDVLYEVYVAGVDAALDTFRNKLR
jgi:hypothetical protein